MNESTKIKLRHKAVLRPRSALRIIKDPTLLPINDQTGTTSGAKSQEVISLPTIHHKYNTVSSNTIYAQKLEYHKECFVNHNAVYYDLEPDDEKFLASLSGAEKGELTEDGLEYLIDAFDHLYPFEGPIADSAFPELYECIKAQASSTFLSLCNNRVVVEKVFKYFKDKRLRIGNKPLIPFFRPKGSVHDRNEHLSFKVYPEGYTGSGALTALSNSARNLTNKKMNAEKLNEAYMRIEKALEIIADVAKREELYEMYLEEQYVKEPLFKYKPPDGQVLIGLSENSYKELWIMTDKWVNKDLELVENAEPIYSPSLSTPKVATNNKKVSRSSHVTNKNTQNMVPPPPRKKDPFKSFLLDEDNDASVSDDAIGPAIVNENSFFDAVGNGKFVFRGVDGRFYVYTKS